MWRVVGGVGAMTVDYWSMVNIDTPKTERRRLGIGDIYENAATCLSCGEYVRSRNRHDFVTCKCGSVSVDGGSWYARRSGIPSKMESHVRSFTDAVTT